MGASLSRLLSVRRCITALLLLPLSATVMLAASDPAPQSDSTASPRTGLTITTTPSAATSHAERSSAALASSDISDVEWKLSVEAGENVTDALNIDNRCKMSHHFSVDAKDLTFATIADSDRVIDVRRGSTRSVPITFQSAGLHGGIASGNLIVKCSDCYAEPGCKQDRENISVVVTVVDNTFQAAPRRCGWFRQIFSRCDERPVPIYDELCPGRLDDTCIIGYAGTKRSWLLGVRKACWNKDLVPTACGGL